MLFYSYHKQSNTLRFTTFTFGPIVMRLLSILKKPTLAYSLFKDKVFVNVYTFLITKSKNVMVYTFLWELCYFQELDGFFDQMSSFTILMDNLLEGEMYNEVLEVYDIVCKKMLDGVRYPHDAVILASAACLKLVCKSLLCSNFYKSCLLLCIEFNLKWMVWFSCSRKLLG